MNDTERQLMEDARRLLDQSADDLDAGTLSRLTAARNRALERRRSRFAPWMLWGGLPAAALTAVLLLVLWPQPKMADDPGYEVADMGILSSEEPLEFYDEMDFYLWLSEVADEENGVSDAAGAEPPAVVTAGLRRGAARG